MLYTGQREPPWCFLALALVRAASTVFGGQRLIRRALGAADQALPVVASFVQAEARNDPAAALALFAAARDPAVTVERIAALFAERRAAFTGVQAVEQTSFTITRTTRGTTATLPGRRTDAHTLARACTAQLVQERAPGGGSVCRLPMGLGAEGRPSADWGSRLRGRRRRPPG